MKNMNNGLNNSVQFYLYKNERKHFALYYVESVADMFATSADNYVSSGDYKNV